VEILVLHPGALGDIILSLPALAALREGFHSSRITLAANVDFARTAASGYADRTISLASLPIYRLHGREPLKEDDRAPWIAYDRVLSWTGHGAPEFTSRFAGVHKCVLVAGWRPDANESRHVARIFLDSLSPWLEPPQDLSPPRVRIDGGLRTEARAWLGRSGWKPGDVLTALSPGASAETKRWPVSHFRELAFRLDCRGTTLVVEGPAEPGLGRSLVEALGPGSVLARLPLPMLAGVLSHCRLYVGNDSGISHLAAALGVPSIVLFGPTSPAHWAPLGARVAIAAAGDRMSMPGIGVDRVVEAVRRMGEV
jgi:ADP-heptose:LPS heptosyltransferase